MSLKDLDGVDREYTIHRLPATLGREIAYQWLNANMPHVGDYKLSKELSNKMMAHVTVQIGDENPKSQPLDSDELINNHAPDWEVLSKLEDEMFSYNTSFLAEGKGSIFSTICDATIRYVVTRMSTRLSDL